MSTDIEQLGYFEIMPRVAEVFEELIEHPDHRVGDAVNEMMDLVDAFHREGLGRLVEMIRAWRGEIFLESASRDDVVGEFLSAYDLGEALDDREMQAATEAVEAALEEMRPYVESDGGMITVDSIKDGVVTVRLLGSCDGCPSSSATLTGGVEEALRRHWVNFRRLEVATDEPEAPAAAPEPAPVLLQIGKKKPEEG
jgi:Fe-S cluster biogenesis protein NfuA